MKLPLLSDDDDDDEEEGFSSWALDLSLTRFKSLKVVGVVPAKDLRNDTSPLEVANL